MHRPRVQLTIQEILVTRSLLSRMGKLVAALNPATTKEIARTDLWQMVARSLRCGSSIMIVAHSSGRILRCLGSIPCTRLHHEILFDQTQLVRAILLRIMSHILGAILYDRPILVVNFWKDLGLLLLVPLHLVLLFWRNLRKLLLRFINFLISQIGLIIWRTEIHLIPEILLFIRR